MGTEDAMKRPDASAAQAPRPWPSWILPACLAIAALTALVLRGMGRRWWCKGGEWWPWAGDIWSPHASQHLFDPYTFTHVLHGVGFYALLALALGRWLDPRRRLVLAVLLESAWEVLENTDAVIQHYRTETISLDYFGDSVLNSMADVLACTAGYLGAMVLPVGASVAGFVAVEALLALWVRDGLLLNIVMLLWPIQAVKAWQMGAAPPP